MIQRKFYLPEDMYMQLQHMATLYKKTTTQLLRELLAEGLERKQSKKKNVARELLKLAHLAEKEGWGKNLPSDLSTNHDKYFFEAWEDAHRGK